MAGYWPFLCVCLWTEMELRSINMPKKNNANIFPKGQTCLVNEGFII